MWFDEDGKSIIKCTNVVICHENNNHCLKHSENCYIEVHLPDSDEAHPMTSGATGNENKSQNRLKSGAK